MRVQIVHHQTNLASMRITLSEHLLYLCRPILTGSPFRDRYMAPTCQRFNFHKYFCDTISDVFIVNAPRLAGFSWYWLSNFTDQLLGRFVHTNHWIRRIIWKMVYFQNIFHRRYKGCVSFRRDFPVFLAVRLKFIFFNTRCTVMCDTLSAKLNSTAFSASSLTVHRWCPSGASEQAKAINRASNAPSKITSLGGFSLGLRSKAASSPSSTKRFFRCSIERLVTPRASATSATFHAKPSGPASQRSKARACLNRLASILPLFVNASSSLRSSLVKVTLYLGDMMASFVVDAISISL